MYECKESELSSGRRMTFLLLVYQEATFNLLNNASVQRQSPHEGEAPVHDIAVPTQHIQMYPACAICVPIPTWVT